MDGHSAVPPPGQGMAATIPIQKALSQFLPTLVPSCCPKLGRGSVDLEMTGGERKETEHLQFFMCDQGACF